MKKAPNKVEKYNYSAEDLELITQISGISGLCTCIKKLSFIFSLPFVNCYKIFFMSGKQTYQKN